MALFSDELGCALFSDELGCALFSDELCCWGTKAGDVLVVLFSDELGCALFSDELGCALFSDELGCALFSDELGCALFSDELCCWGTKAGDVLGFEFSDIDGSSGLVAFNSVVGFCSEDCSSPKLEVEDFC
ncbi:MAG TPA: hypothetical protein VGE97_02185 [Nitrososphaera sp.]